jgi:hypothetical protein
VPSEELTDTLAEAVADHRAIEWPAEGDRDEADPALVRSLKVISAISAARRAHAVVARERDATSLSRASALVLAVGGYKLALAATSAAAGWSRVPALSLAWPFAFNLVLFGVAGLILLTGGARDRRVRSLGVLFIIIASAFADPLMPAPSGNPWPAWAHWTAHATADAFLALALWQFVWLFPSEPSLPGARRLGRAFLTAATVVGALLLGANLTIGLHWFDPNGAPHQILAMLDRTASTRLYWPVLFVLAAPAIPYLLWKSRVDTLPDRRRVTWFVASLVIGLSPILFAVIVTPLVPDLAESVWRQRIGLLLYVALASTVPSVVYAVAVSHVLDLHLVVRKTVQYGLARTSVWCAIIGPLVYLAVDLNRNRGLRVEEYLSDVRPIGFVLLSILSFSVLTFRHQILARVDRWFQRNAADHTEALARLERGFRPTRTIREISSVLKREIERAVRPTSVAVMMVDEGRGQLVSLESAVPPLEKGSALLDLLRSIRTEIQLSYRADGAVAGLLPPEDRAWLASTGFGLFSPLVGSAGSLLGVVGIGRGQNGLAYTERDCMLITAMSGQAAMKLENSRLKERSGSGIGREPVEGVADWENEPAERCPDCCAMWRPGTRHCTCGSPTVEAALPLNVKGKFQVERFIGAGGTGVVYLAVDLALDRKVAIKTLPSIRLEHASRLHREARAMANVLHPNLALIYGAEQWKGTPLLVFEYLEGGTLLDSLRRGPLDLEEVIDLGTLLADALDRVHGSAILHRDIKPSNIGYTSEGVPKLLDFGLAAILDRSRGTGTLPAVLPSDPRLIAELAWGTEPTTTLTITQQLVGTPLYLSPEALAGQAPQPTFDLWGLCVVLFEAYAGRHPLAGESIVEVIRTIQRGTLPDVRDFRSDCPPAFACFLNDSLSPMPGRRPVSAADLRTRLRWLQSHLFPAAS